MSKKSKQSDRTRIRDLSFMGLDAQSLPADLVAQLQEVQRTWILIDGHERSMPEVIQMCFEVGIELCPDTIDEAMRNELFAAFSDVERFNIIILSAAVTDFFRYACQAIMLHALEFERLVDQYENTSDGRSRAAKESGFFTFGPVITTKLCAAYAAELESIRRNSETITDVGTSIELVQLVVLVAGLKALRLSGDESTRASFKAMLDSESASIEEIGEMLLARGIPFIKQSLAHQALKESLLHLIHIEPQQH